MHSVAERLASHGFVVLAPDHLGNTHFDDEAALDDAFLAVRAADMVRVLDAALAPGAPALPGPLRGQLDPARVGVLGHSFGAVTAGKLLELDARVRAGFLFAAPVDSPVLNSGGLARIHQPLSWLLAKEDGSISSTGNQFIRENVAAAPRPTWLVELADAGHWSFTDIAGLGGAFTAGCGSGLRDPGGEPFTWLTNDTARAAAQRYAVAWARALLLGDEAAEKEMDRPVPADVVRVWRR
jgi:dienelactone hydrolase